MRGSLNRNFRKALAQQEGERFRFRKAMALTEGLAGMTSAGYCEDVTMTEAPAVPETVETPSRAEATEQRSPLAERLFNACVPGICRKPKKSSPGKENREASTQKRPETNRRSVGLGFECVFFDEDGMVVEPGTGESNPWETFRFQEATTEPETPNNSPVSMEALEEEMDFGDAQIMEYLRMIRGPFAGDSALSTRGLNGKRSKLSVMRSLLGWRFPGALESDPMAKFGASRRIPKGDEMVFQKDKERRRFLQYYPGGKAFPERIHTARRIREEDPWAVADFDSAEDDDWRMEVLSEQRRKIDDLSALTSEFVSNRPTRSTRAATWLKEMDLKRGPIGKSPPGSIPCAQCGREGSPEKMDRCKGGVSRSLGRQSAGAGNGACGRQNKAPGECNRPLCKVCKSECVQCGEPVCGKHSWSTGFGCSRRRFCLSCEPSADFSNRVFTERHVAAPPCPMCQTRV